MELRGLTFKPDEISTFKKTENEKISLYNRNY